MPVPDGMPVPGEAAVAVGVGAEAAVMPLLSQITVKALPSVSVEDGGGDEHTRTGRRHHPGRTTLVPYGIPRGKTVSPCNAAERKAGVFEAGDIREWRGHDVVDSDGHKIGELEAIYVDTSTDLPAFATVTVGLPTRHRLVFVPLAQATVGPGYLKVAHDRKQVKDSPSISTDGELPATDEEAIFKHYGLTYQAGTGGERQLARR